jgi:acyl phosphate:glycerol-3-phosphate acyltransferase
MPDASFFASPGTLLAAAVLGYLFGSIPFGLLLTRMAGLGDIRAIGSGNIGTTNVLRTGRKDLAAATLLLDALKGTAAVLIAFHFWGQNAAIVAGFFAFLGHLFPVWLKFKGGKGVATYLGLLAAFAWPIALFFIAVWISVAFITRYSSASALTASLLSPIALLLFGYSSVALLFAVLSIILWVMHRANIGRLLAGTESRLGKKK